ncbi:MAG: hypothetical protein JST79_15840 [Acidobacteria bacterium]|nr:hypothetical protein [Acidobacteriota bacterium]
MNARVNLWPGELLCLSAPPVEKAASAEAKTASGLRVSRFAEEQLLRLVRQVFSPGWPRPARQVIFCAIEEETDVAGVCRWTGEILARHVPGNVGLVEMQSGSHSGPTTHPGERQEWQWPGYWRQATRQIASRLWQVPAQAVWSGEPQAQISDRLHDRLGELRLDFDFTLLQGPAVGTYSDALVLGQACDGMVLVVEAHRTRRAAAQRAKERLLAAQVRILGSVLSGRTFPIPQSLYDRW